MSSRMKTQAKFLAYSLKAGENRLVMVTGLSKINKTKSVKELIEALRKITGVVSLTFILSGSAKGVVKFLRNLDKVKAVYYKDASVYDIFSGGMVVMDAGIFKTK